MSASPLHAPISDEAVRLAALLIAHGAMLTDTAVLVSRGFPVDEFPIAFGLPVLVREPIPPGPPPPPPRAPRRRRHNQARRFFWERGP